jgi:hypothetical protein
MNDILNDAGLASVAHFVENLIVRSGGGVEHARRR